MKILFVNTHLDVGGIRRALLNLLPTIADHNCQIDLFLLKNDENARRDCEMLQGVNLCKPSLLMTVFFTSIKDYLTKRDIFKMIIKIMLFGLTKIFGMRKTLLFLMGFQKSLNGYDVAISFSNDIWAGEFWGGCNDFVLQKTIAKRKIAWVHSDPYKLGFTEEICRQTYHNFNCIVNVSNACKEKFDEIVPEYAFKSKVVYNMFNVEEIRNKGEELNPFDWGGFRIVTVARIKNQPKRIDRIIETCRRLKHDGITDFRWYVLGDGPDLQWLKEEAANAGVNDIVIFTGNKSNPYPYMKNADLFVQTSLYEAYSMVLLEALTVGLPIISTNYDSASEIVEQGLNGMITQNSTDGVYKAVKEVLLDRSMLETMRNRVAKQEIGNELAFRQFWDVIYNR